jgi:alpha-glucuronidase
LRAGGDYVADPGLLLKRMRPSVWAQWRLMAEIDPFDGNRLDRGFGEVAAAAMNAAGAKKATGEPLTPADFMAYRRLQQDPEEEQRNLSRSLRALLSANSKKG